MEHEITSSWNKERIAKLAICSFSRFGSRSLRKIWLGFSSCEVAWVASASALIACGLTEKTAQTFVEWRKRFSPADAIERMENEKIRVLFRNDAEYPLVFSTVSDPPEVLFFRGKLPSLVSAISIVGTRKMSPYGARCIALLVPSLCKHGSTIVSGMAFGIDAEVHRSCLATHGQTVAILGSGVDDASLYPRANLFLAHEIVASDGALLSEFPPGTECRKEYFPIRNRLIAAISPVTVVVEASRNSGSLITAKCALEENREVLAVPGPIWSEQSMGTNHLLKLGARVCASPEDILDALGTERVVAQHQAEQSLPLDATDTVLLENLTEPCHVDALSQKLSLPSSVVSSRLTMLELKGCVKPIGGQTWIISE